MKSKATAQETKSATRSKTKRSLSSKKQSIAKGKSTKADSLKDRTICNGNVVLFKRNRSANWQCRIKRYMGVWVDYSTNQSDFNKEKKAAEERYRDIKYQQEHGLIDITRRFSDVCKVAKKELLSEYESSGRILPKQLTQVIDKYLIPLLGTYQCHNISRDVLREFSGKRAEMMGKVPTQSTVNTHNTALNYVLRKAHDLNYIEFVPKPINDGDGTKKRRTYFSDKDYRKLTNFMRSDLVKSRKLYEAKGRNGLDTLTLTSYEIRQLLRDVVLILANSGIRCGDELLNLKWNNLSIVIQDEIESIRFALTHTTTNKQRFVVGYESKRGKDDERYGCWKPLKRIAERFDDLKDLSWEELFTKDEYIFRLPSTRKVVKQEALTKNFKLLLKRCDLLTDDFGNVRVLYSLRHTYVSRRRFEGMSFDDISEQVGTSVQMLEKHYNHFTVSDNPNLFSGHAKRQQRSKDKEIEELKKQIEKLKKEHASSV